MSEALEQHQLFADVGAGAGLTASASLRRQLDSLVECAVLATSDVEVTLLLAMSVAIGTAVNTSQVGPSAVRVTDAMEAAGSTT
jgi:hypothetical protein